MFETFGVAAPPPGIQELEKFSGRNGSATFDFDEILRREQEQDLHAERDNVSEPEVTNRTPQEGRLCPDLS